jgi:HD superfamily phosphodiesterase
MNKIERLTKLVRTLYEKKSPSRSPWADYLYHYHIFLVADIARSLAEEFSINNELPIAASILHDIGDAEISRFDPKHEAETLKIARYFLDQSGFSKTEIAIVVDDSIINHWCYNWITPTSIEGKIMATADAIGHLTSDFYTFALSQKRKQEPMDIIRKWALPKIERDFYQKICFNEVREKYRTDYERCKKLFWEP